MVGLVHSLKNKKEVFMNVNDLAKQVSSIITPKPTIFTATSASMVISSTIQTTRCGGAM